MLVARHGSSLLVIGCVSLLACRRGGSQASEREQAAPSASVVTIGNAIGTCPDVPACERECEAGSADRCRRLAATYAFGQGVDKDDARATALYEHACDMKDGPACMFAGQMHEFSHGVPQDYAAAARFYERACDIEYAAGCYNLAILVEKGRGVAPDRARAADLYQVACTAGAKQACDKARELHAPPLPSPDTAAPNMAAACDHPCSKGEDCASAACPCEDGTVVSTRSCVNGCCARATETCPSACQKHDGPSGTWNASRDGTKTGGVCASDRACASGVCLQGVCSKRCTSFAECPPFWTCNPGTNGRDSYCRKGG
jgi:hypothetical protein